MESLESELEQAQSLSTDEIADAIESIGFECTRCGACCKASGCETQEGEETETGRQPQDPHTATVFPDEVRAIMQSTSYDWRDVARPMPYGLSADGTRGETFEWALQTGDCSDCTFYEDEADRCSIYESRPLICQTYPFSIALGGTTQPMGKAVDQEGVVRAHECEGLGRDIDRETAEELAATLQKRAIHELEEAINVRDNYEPVRDESVVVYDSEGPKRPDGSSIEPSN